MITMKNLHLATEQQVFDQVARHLLTQNTKAINDLGVCKYRFRLNDNTILKCAVGFLIADDEYSQEMEGSLYGSYDFNEFFGFKGEAPHLTLLRSLQNLHDKHPVLIWKEELEKIAADFNLNIDILKEFN